MNRERSWIEIDLSNYIANLDNIKSFMESKQDFLQIIKADAYGHGAYQIAKTAIEQGAKLLGVANFDEGSLIRYQGIESDILILSPSLDSEIDSIIEHNLIPTINDIEFAHKVNSAASKLNKVVKVHINIDTGMNRSGVRADSALDFIQEISKLKGVQIDGLFTHFAESENDSIFTLQQYNLFCQTIDIIIKEIPELQINYLHCSNSCGVINYNFPRMNLVRIGILSFGIYTTPELKEKIKLSPVMRFKTTVSQIKLAKCGEYISYNRTYQTETEMPYAILPIGYADGYDFMLSNRGVVLHNNRLLPIRGKVTMDMTLIESPENNNINIGDEVLLFGSSQLRIEQLTKLYSGSPYELATQIGKRAKRYYFFEGKIESEEPLLRRDFYTPDFSDKRLSKVIEEALHKRISSNEISNLLFKEIITKYIANSDQNIAYRKNFNHTIEFKLSDEFPEFYEVHTVLSYTKRLNSSSFIIACATDLETLNHYFQKSDVEYRWLLAENIQLTQKAFSISNIQVNNTPVTVKTIKHKNSLEYQCSSPKLQDVVGTETQFYIETKTYYPKSSHQLSVYITEPTQGVNITFKYPKTISKVETITILSGEGKYPNIDNKKNEIQVNTGISNWLFPNSGVVFSY